jgi:hypothetical protein
VALKSRPRLSDEGASLDGFSETQIIFSFLSTARNTFGNCTLSFGEGAQRAGEVIVYFFLLKKKSKSQSGLRTNKNMILSDSIKN